MTDSVPRAALGETSPRIDANAPPREAIRVLFQLYADDIYRFARLSLGRHEDAKDAVQEVFLKAFRAYGSFRHDANSKTWLLSIAKHHLTDVIRRRQTERNYLASFELPEWRGEAVSVETLMVLEQSLLALKPNYRHAFVLRHVENFTVDEIAQLLGWSNAKVRTTLHRAIVKLRAMLSTSTEEAGGKL